MKIWQMVRVFCNRLYAGKFQRRSNADALAGVVGMMRGEFGDFSDEIPVHCSVFFL